jgi:hypothetical protein
MVSSSLDRRGARWRPDFRAGFRRSSVCTDRQPALFAATVPSYPERYRVAVLEWLPVGIPGALYDKARKRPSTASLGHNYRIRPGGSAGAADTLAKVLMLRARECLESGRAVRDLAAEGPGARYATTGLDECVAAGSAATRGSMQ